MNASPCLSASNLQFSYGGKPVFASVDLSVAAREIVCLVGASGCGKSTLLRLLAGLLQNPAGQVTLVGSRAETGKGNSAVVFQSPALLPWLSVAENVAFGLTFKSHVRRESRSERRARVQSALEQVGLGRHAQQRIQHLSGGMAQRVALARALVRNPDIIFLDEPFSALDAITRESMQDLLLTLTQRRDSAVLLVTHDIDEALRVADRILLLAGNPARIVGEWRPPGKVPRQQRTPALNEMREHIRESLGEQHHVF